MNVVNIIFTQVQKSENEEKRHFFLSLYFQAHSLAGTLPISKFCLSRKKSNLQTFTRFLLSLFSALFDFNSTLCLYFALSENKILSSLSKRCENISAFFCRLDQHINQSVRKALREDFLSQQLCEE